MKATVRVPERNKEIKIMWHISHWKIFAFCCSKALSPKSQDNVGNDESQEHGQN